MLLSSVLNGEDNDDQDNVLEDWMKMLCIDLKCIIEWLLLKHTWAGCWRNALWIFSAIKYLSGEYLTWLDAGSYVLYTFAELAPYESSCNGARPIDVSTVDNGGGNGLKLQQKINENESCVNYFSIEKNPFKTDE